MFHKLKYVFISLLLLSIISACSTGEPSDNKENSEASGDDHSQVTLGGRENITSIDPHDGSTSASNSILGAIYESLYELGEDGEMQPALATDYEVSDDGLDYTFELRDDVEFTDGTKFDGEAVKVNFERILDSEGSLAAHRSIQNVDNVEVSDDNKVKITLNEPNNQFIFKMENTRIASPKAFENDDIDLSQETLGSGPFTLDKWNHGESLVMTKNDNYWDSEYPKVDQITYKPVPENGSRVAMLKAGDVDLIYPLPEKDIDSLEEDDDIAIEIDDSTVVRYATINTQKEQFEDKNVRKAMNYAIDKEQFANIVKSGYSEPPKSILPPPVAYYSEQTPYEYDLDKAKEMMKEAGESDGFSMEIWGDDSSENKQAMQFIQQQLKEINIDVDIQQFERGTLDDKINGPDGPDDAEVQMWYVSWSTEPGDTDNGIRPLFSSDAFPSNGANTAYYENEKVDKLLDSALMQTEEDKADKEYGEIQEIIFDDAPWLFLGVDDLVYAKNKNLEGIWITASGGIKMKETELN